MSTELRVTLEGPHGHMDAGRVFEIWGKLLQLLGSLEEGSTSGTWAVKDLHVGSAGIALAPEKPGRDRSTDVMDRAAERLVTGFAEALDHEGLPSWWTTEDARLGLALANKLGRDMREGMRLAVWRDGKRSLQVEVTREVSGHLARAANQRYESIGSVIGRLDSFNMHDGMKAGLWEESTGYRVEVSFTEQQADHVAAAARHRQRVEASGRVRRESDDRPILVRLRHLEVLPEREDAPPLTDLIGLDPNFTGGLTAEEYVREMRGKAL